MKTKKPATATSRPRTAPGPHRAKSAAKVARQVVTQKRGLLNRLEEYDRTGRSHPMSGSKT